MLCSWTTCCLLWWVRVGVFVLRGHLLQPRWAAHTTLEFSNEWTWAFFFICLKTHRSCWGLEATAGNGAWSLTTIAERPRDSMQREVRLHLTKEEVDLEPALALFYFLLIVFHKMLMTPSGLEERSIFLLCCSSLCSTPVTYLIGRSNSSSKPIFPVVHSLTGNAFSS